MSDTTLPTTPPIETDAGGQTPASLDKVRDILLGNQVRDFERRFARLEERLITETNSLVVRRATSYVEPRFSVAPSRRQAEAWRYGLRTE